MKSDSRVSFLAHNFATPYFGREPKPRVATHMLWRLSFETTNYSSNEKLGMDSFNTPSIIDSFKGVS
jgi:hypothetical protein